MDQVVDGLEEYTDFNDGDLSYFQHPMETAIMICNNVCEETFLELSYFEVEKFNQAAAFKYIVLKSI